MIYIFLFLLFGVIQVNASEQKERQYTFSGYLKSIRKHCNVADKKLTLSFWKKDANVRYTVVTDSVGGFSLPVPEMCQGAWTVYISMPAAKRGADYQIEMTSHGRKVRTDSTSQGLVYDCDKAVDSILAHGLEMPTLYEWLLKQNTDFSKQNRGLSFPNSIEYPDHHFYVGRPGYEIYHKFNLPYEDACCLMYEKRPIVWIFDGMLLRISNIPETVLGEWRNEKEWKERRRKACPEDQDEKLNTYRQARIVKDGDVWKQYLDLPALEKYHPATVFLTSRAVYIRKTSDKNICATYLDGYED